MFFVTFFSTAAALLFALVAAYFKWQWKSRRTTLQFRLSCPYQVKRFYQVPGLERNISFFREPFVSLHKNMLGMANGEEWKRQRELFGGALRERYKHFPAIALRQVNKMVAQLEDKTDNSTLNVFEWMQDLPFEAMIGAVYGPDLSDDERCQLARLRVLSRRVMAVSFETPGEEPTEEDGLADMAREFKRMWCRFNDAQVKKLERSGEDANGSILSALLSKHGPHQSNPELLYDTLEEATLSNFDGTAATLSWPFFHLAANPEVQARLRSQLTSSSSLPAHHQGDGTLPFGDVKYLGHVLKESSRLSPIFDTSVPLFPCEDVKVSANDAAIPAKSAVMVDIRALNTGDHWDEPNRFKPERWKQPKPYAHYQFGYGRRQCVGQAYAIAMAKSILAAMLTRYDLLPPTADAAEEGDLLASRRMGFVTVPAGMIRLRARSS